MTDNPLSRYQRLLDNCEIRPDLMQRAMALQLQRVFDIVTAPDYFAAATANSSLFSGLFSRRKKPEATHARVYGMYIWGDVGRGKSMLMDIFYHALPTPKKKRLHFLQFMLDVHGRIHKHRTEGRKGDPILEVANDIAGEIDILCFDEFQVSDITDAMILSRLFTTLFNAGMVVIFTSNRPPEALYLGGLQREKFIPFIDLLRERVEIHELASKQDYRLGRMNAIKETYLTPLNAQTDAALDDAFRSLSHQAPSTTIDIPVAGRTLHVTATSGDIACFTFEELCARPLGALDYMAITALFKTIFIRNIPRLTPDNRNEAKRFVTLVDVLYEAHATLICTAAAIPQELYVSGDGSFEFQRTASRLMQMQSEDWLNNTSS